MCSSLRAVGTNVSVNLLLGGPSTAQAQALYSADPEWFSQTFALVEWANVLATQVRLRDMPLVDALGLLECGARMIEPGIVEIAHAAARWPGAGRFCSPAA